MLKLISMPEAWPEHKRPGLGARSVSYNGRATGATPPPIGVIGRLATGLSAFSETVSMQGKPVSAPPDFNELVKRLPDQPVQVFGAYNQKQPGYLGTLLDLIGPHQRIPMISNVFDSLNSPENKQEWIRCNTMWTLVTNGDVNQVGVDRSRSVDGLNVSYSYHEPVFCGVAGPREQKNLNDFLFRLLAACATKNIQTICLAGPVLPDLGALDIEGTWVQTLEWRVVSSGNGGVRYLFSYTVVGEPRQRKVSIFHLPKLTADQLNSEMPVLLEDEQNIALLSQMVSRKGAIYLGCMDGVSVSPMLALMVLSYRKWVEHFQPFNKRLPIHDFESFALGIRNLRSSAFCSHDGAVLLKGAWELTGKLVAQAGGSWQDSFESDGYSIANLSGINSPPVATSTPLKPPEPTQPAIFTIETIDFFATVLKQSLYFKSAGDLANLNPKTAKKLFETLGTRVNGIAAASVGWHHNTTLLTASEKKGLVQKLGQCLPKTDERTQLMKLVTQLNASASGAAEQLRWPEVLAVLNAIIRTKIRTD